MPAQFRYFGGTRHPMVASTLMVQRAAATALLMIAMLQYLSAAGSLCDAQEHHSAHMHLSHQDTAAAGRHCYEAQQLATMQLMQWRYLHPAINSTAATQQAVQQGSSASSAGKKHSMHLERPINATVAASRRALQRYLSGRRFVTLHDSMLEQQQRHSRRGILIAAGGKVLLAQVVVLLKVLRHHLRCRLPVEVAWQGRAEMQKRTLAALQQQFGPLSGFDVKQKPYPRPLRRPGLHLTRYVAKVAALLHCTFHEVIMLDADSLPVVNPEQHFADPLYQQAGNLFWPDYWKGWVSWQVYPFLGLNATTVKPLLAAGAGWTGRDAESGMVVIDRTRWLGVLHWVFWINAWHDPVYSMMLGDKDTYALGFALAGHADQYRQVYVLPGAAFTWGPGWLLNCSKSGNYTTCTRGDGWLLLGMLQHDNYGHPAYFHRTALKLGVGETPPPAQILTGPLPYRWIRYFIALDMQGPTSGKDSRHVAPSTAFDMVHIDPLPTLSMPSLETGLEPVMAHLRLPATTGGTGSELDRSGSLMNISTSPAASTGRLYEPSWGKERAAALSARKGGRPSSIANATVHQGEPPRTSNSSNRNSGMNRSTNAAAWDAGSCPVVLFTQYVQAMRLALPVDPQPWLDTACKHLMPLLLQKHKPLPLEPLLPLRGEYLHAIVRDVNGTEVADSSRIPALRCSRPYTASMLRLSSTLRAIHQSEAALRWLQSEQGRLIFPSLVD